MLLLNPSYNFGGVPLVNYLVVAGGGATNSYGSGAGAGGVRTAMGLIIPGSTPLTIIVGAGGAAGANNGGNSRFHSIISTGGGYGGWATNNSGGSGAGGGYWIRSDNLAYGPSTPGSGNAGGFNPPEGYGGIAAAAISSSFGSDRVSGTGGGGAGGPGSINTGGNAETGGNGGPGIISSITGTAVGYGGGGCGNGTYGGPGTASHGAVANAAGTANTGAGASAGASGFAGGSGIVVISYSAQYKDPSAVTGSPTITLVNGFKIYQWKTVGTWSITF